MSQTETSRPPSRGSDNDETSLTRKLHETTHELTYRRLHSSDYRLLVLYPGSSRDPVCCAFIHTDLADPFRYEAISYAWGSATRTNLVFSTSGHSAIPVTASAYSALKAVRYTDKRRVLWIDGLCINQRNEVEKAHQVGIMGRIYGKAERTLVYLGEDDDDFAYTAYTLRCLQRHHEPGVPLEEEHPLQRALKKVDFEHNETLEHMVYAAYLARETEYASQDSFKPLLEFRRAFFARPWFTRLWIMQEVALSKEVVFHFAGQAIVWGTIMALYNLLDFWFHQRDQKFYGHPVVSDRSILGTKVFERFTRLDNTGPTGFPFAGEWLILRHRIAAFDQPEEYYSQGRGPLTVKRHLVDLMYEMRHYRCGDARDRLYAILSMFDEDIPEILKPDYKASTTTSKVFANITRCLISKGNFDVLAAAQGLPTQRPDLPSWAVNWEDPPDRERFFTTKSLGGDVQVGTKDGMPSVLPKAVLKSNDDNRIVLRGMALGKLTYVGPACPLNADDETFQKVYSCWIWWNKYIHSLDELGMSRSQLPTPDSIAGSDILPLSHVSQDPYYLIPDSAVNRDIRDKTFKEHCQGRAFATVGHVDWDGDWEKFDALDWSANNAKALVPSRAEEGDLLCGILGFEIAVVLRPAASGGYRFVGTSSCWELAMAKAAPELDWNDLDSEHPQAPLQDFSIH